MRPYVIILFTRNILAMNVFNEKIFAVVYCTLSSNVFTAQLGIFE